MRTLLGCSEARERARLDEVLRAGGCEVDCVELGHDLLGQARREPYAALVIGDELPDLSAPEVVTMIRRLRIPSMVLVVGLDDLRTTVEALDAGADDYVAAPVHGEELLARLRAIQRRATAEEGAWLRSHGVEIHLPSRSVWVKTHPLTLTPREFKVLELLVRSTDRTTPRSLLLERIWGMQLGESDGNVVDVYISRVRRKLRACPGAQLIRTIAGTGYSLQPSCLTPTSPDPAAGLLQSHLTMV